MKRFKHYGLFEKKWYLKNNPDVAAANVNPLKHYLNHGWRECRNPSARFDGNAYLRAHADVRSAGVCPLVHYIRHGRKEHRAAVDVYGKDVRSKTIREFFISAIKFPTCIYKEYHMLKDELKK